MTTKAVERATCECGGGFNPSRKHFHLTSNQHRAWVERQDAPKDAPPPQAATLPAGVTAGIMCPDCGGGPFLTFEEIDKHRAGNAHVALRAAQAKVLREQQEEAQGHLADGLPADLKEPVVNIKLTLQERAKMVRHAFSARGWPNQEHPGTVLQFLEEHHIPIALDLSRRQISNPNKFAAV